MRVNINELLEGCILSEDIYSLTNRPIVSKKTIITNELIGILKAFLIREVHVDKLMVNGSPFQPREILDDDGIEQKSVPTIMEASLEDAFLIGVRDYKKEFKNWQAGIPIDFSKIRNIMIPLVEKSEVTPSELFSLHHLSTQDEYLYQHAVAVGLISAFIGKKLKMNKGDIVQLAIGGCLSDAGMAKIKPAILNKKSTLTKQEFEEMKKHTTYSYKMVQNISLLRESTKIGILQHHERLDGSGYPLGEKNNKINIFAKIIGVADTFHAMTCSRLYRRKQSPFKVLEMMLQDMFGKYDITAMQAIGSGIMTFSIGSSVKLSDDRVAEILFIEEKSPTRPLVKITQTDEIIHLEKNRQLFIEEVLK
ncbi:HD-GYP domain-containing protein [Cytobacillus massiliigabonensis]|uniref:HD-GYP domain-containing protein n=1 Tax=Cytobacillus massiliigabonensis TaxID=1871011 RepID=UPI000C82DB9F|nr:HD-GYP domain-containing protein [Cytobacillus massiliigabonensis]